MLCRVLFFGTRQINALPCAFSLAHGKVNSLPCAKKKTHDKAWVCRVFFGHTAKE